MRATFDVNVPKPDRRDKTVAGEAVAQMTAPEDACQQPIPITRARETSPAVNAMFMERRTDSLRLELETQLQRAEDAEKRFQRALSRAQADVVTLSGEVQVALRKLTHAENTLRQKQSVLRQLLRRLGALDKEREAASRAREALEGLKTQYDEYYRTRALRSESEKTHAGVISEESLVQRA